MGSLLNYSPSTNLLKLITLGPSLNGLTIATLQSIFNFSPSILDFASTYVFLAMLSQFSIVRSNLPSSVIISLDN
jgi:hypothetical protein